MGGALSSAALVLNFVNGLIAAFEFLILLATITALLPVAFSTAAVWLFSLREPEYSRWETARSAVIALVGFGYAMWALAGSGRDSVFWGFMLLMVGVPVYVWIIVGNERGSE